MEQRDTLAKPAVSAELPPQFVYCDFSDDVWYVMVTGTRKSIHWNRVRLADGKSLTLHHHELLLAAKHFMVLVATTPVGGKRTPLKGNSLSALFGSLRGFLYWLSSRGVYGFPDITIEHIISYRMHVETSTTVVKHKSGLMPPGTIKPIAQQTKFGKIQTILYLTRLQTAMGLTGTRLKAYEVADVLASITGNASTGKPTERIPDDLFKRFISAAISFLREPGLATIIERIESFEAEFKRYDAIAGQDLRTMKTAARRVSFYHQIWRKNSKTPPPAMINGAEYDLSKFGLRDFANFATILRGACLAIIAGLVGMRLSELRILETGCLRPMRLDDGRVLLRIHGTLFKTADGVDGEPAEWVAGWDEPGNPVHDAIDILERLALAEKVTALFPRLHATRLHAPGKNNDNSMSHRAMGPMIQKFAIFVNVGADWPFAMHQFRKTFARFVALSHTDATLALMRHFKHVRILMTERYLPNDPDFIGEIIEASEALVAERLDAVFGAERLSGFKGEEILSNNLAYRGDAHADERRELVSMTMRDPSVRVLLHIYGICIYDQPSAKCKGDFANIGMWTCVDCSNALMDESVAPFWEEQISRLDDAIVLREQLGFIDLELMKQRDRAVTVLEGLKRGDRQTA